VSQVSTCRRGSVWNTTWCTGAVLRSASFLEHENLEQHYPRPYFATQTVFYHH
jgi:hypothetical protein